MCVHYKCKNIQMALEAGYFFIIESFNRISGFHEFLYSRTYYENMD